MCFEERVDSPESDLTDRLIVKRIDGSSKLIRSEDGSVFDTVGGAIRFMGPHVAWYADGEVEFSSQCEGVIQQIEGGLSLDLGVRHSVRIADLLPFQQAAVLP